MTATTTKIDRTIDRQGLRQAIGLPDKIDRFHCGVYLQVACPTWNGRHLAKLRAKREPSDRDLDTIARLADRQQVVAVLDVLVALGANEPGRKSSQHRVFVICPCCYGSIPAGRFHQHTKQVGAEIVCRRAGKPLPTECRGDYPPADPVADQPAGQVVTPDFDEIW